jgi:hypothetical protein
LGLHACVLWLSLFVLMIFVGVCQEGRKASTLTSNWQNVGKTNQRKWEHKKSLVMSCPQCLRLTDLCKQVCVSLFSALSKRSVHQRRSLWQASTTSSNNPQQQESMNVFQMNGVNRRDQLRHTIFPRAHFVPALVALLCLLPSQPLGGGSTRTQHRPLHSATVCSSLSLSPLATALPLHLTRPLRHLASEGRNASCIHSATA